MQEKCSARGCCRLSVVKKHKLCRTHYMRYRRNGNTGDHPIKIHNWIKPYKAQSDENTLGK